MNKQVGRLVSFLARRKELMILPVLHVMNLHTQQPCQFDRSAQFVVKEITAVIRLFRSLRNFVLNNLASCRTLCALVGEVFGCACVLLMVNCRLHVHHPSMCLLMPPRVLLYMNSFYVFSSLSISACAAYHRER